MFTVLVLVLVLGLTFSLAVTAYGSRFSSSVPVPVPVPVPSIASLQTRVDALYDVAVNVSDYYALAVLDTYNVRLDAVRRGIADTDGPRSPVLLRYNPSSVPGPGPVFAVPSSVPVPVPYRQTHADTCPVCRPRKLRNFRRKLRATTKY